MFDDLAFDVQSFSADAWLFGAQTIPASLGAWGDHPRKRPARVEDKEHEIQEALPPAVVSRLRDELLAGVVLDEAAKRRRARADEEALLMMLM